MANRPSAGDLEGARRSQQMLWFAFLAATFVYLVAAVVLGGKRTAGGFRMESLPALIYLFYALGAVLFAGAFLVRRRLDGMTLPDAAAAIRGSMTALVAGLALMDAVPLLGLVLVLLGAEVREALPLLAGGILGMLLLRPDLSALEERIRTRPGA